MSLTPNARRRAAFLFDRARALRGTSNALDQLEAQLHAEREQHAFVVGELEKRSPCCCEISCRRATNLPNEIWLTLLPTRRPRR